ncbi:MAG: lipid II:glycine glycyltransferase FemX [Candidatus Dormibacteria bacterium]
MVPLSPAEHADYDRAVAAAWHGSWLQSTAWGELKSGFGWTPHRLGLVENGRLTGGIQLLQRRLPGGFSLLYAPRGPVLAEPDPECLSVILRGVRELGRRLRAPVIKFDPEWPIESDATRALLSVAGIRTGGRDVQHRATMIIDLDRDEDALLESFKSVCRYSIRYAERNGVTVELTRDAAAIERFYPLLQVTAARQNFVVRAQPYYLRLAQLLADRGELRTLFASVEGEVIGGAVMVHFGNTLHYLFGGSTGAHPRLKPNYLLHWRAMQDARESGLTRYDMWGVPAEPREGERGWGYYVFKSKFNATLVRFPGMMETGALPGLDRLFRLAEGMVRQAEPEFA